MPNTRFLDPHEIDAAAKFLGCDVPVVLAVRDVEAGPRGFGADMRPLILYEGHIFSKLTGHRFDKSHPQVSWPRWDKTRYFKDQAARWQQWDRAATLDRAAAIGATSFGLFQVMGFNARDCGWRDEESFFASMCLDEGEHLRAFVGYVIANGLADELRRHDWVNFALGYNGPRAAENRYAEKMAKAYQRHSAATAPA